jgi:BNR repeat-containing family member
MMKKTAGILTLAMVATFAALNLVTSGTKDQAKGLRQGAVKVKTLKVISDRASNRATSYELSNKIITAKDRIFVAWLDEAQHVRVSTYDLKSDAWSEPADLGAADDNHGGPALTMDSQGYLYAVFGPHAANPLRFRRSQKPYDAESWDKLAIVPSGGATYPCAVFDDKDTMHIVYRCHVTTGGPIVLRHIRRFRDGTWSKPIDLADAAPGAGKTYRSYYASLAISKDGIIHLATHLFKENAYAHFAYMCSQDGGDTWENVKGEKLRLPVTPDSPCVLRSESTPDEMPGWKNGSTRIGNIALDDKGDPWIVYGRFLWHRVRNVMETIDLGPHVEAVFPGKELTIVGSITFDKDGALYLVSHVRPQGESGRAPNSSEVILMTSVDHGQSFHMSLVSHENPKNPDVPNWAPNIERPYNARLLDHAPSFIYQAGDPGWGNPGNKGGVYVNDPRLRMELVFVRLMKE